MSKLAAAAAVALAAVLAAVRAPPAAAAPSAEAEAWRADLEARVIADLAAGRPLVVQVHVPLCEKTIIPCGNARLGDGDRPAGNLYWATTEGFLGWFGRKGGGWKQVLVSDGAAIDEPRVLDLRVWRRELATPAAWRGRGAPARFTMVVVAQAWRGVEIDAALTRYAEDLYGAHRQAVALPDGTSIAAGGDAHVVAYVGHNRLMDLVSFDWRAVAARGDDVSRGVIAIACHTAPYMKDIVPGPRQVPLILTRDYMLASAAALEGAALAFARGGDYAAIRRGGAQGYADGGKKPLRRVFGAFTNPAHDRWDAPDYSRAIEAHARLHRIGQSP